MSFLYSVLFGFLRSENFGVAIVAGVHIDDLAVDGAVVMDNFIIAGVGDQDHPPLLLVDRGTCGGPRKVCCSSLRLGLCCLQLHGAFEP